MSRHNDVFMHNNNLIQHVYRFSLAKFSSKNETILSTSDNQLNSDNNPIPSTSDLIINNKQSLAASYAVALEIGKRKKNFSDGLFIKHCVIAMAEAFDNNVITEQFKTVALSPNIIFRRIISLNFFEIKLEKLIQNCYFFLCLNEVRMYLI